MTKRILAVFLMVILSLTSLLALSACKSGTDASGSSRKDKVLTVCFDSYMSPADNQRNMYDFMFSFTQATGIENVEFEYLPSSGVERETAIQRIRTEIMAGAGPDVFLVLCGSADYALFPYPEKVMEAGLFLPLDEYMENNTQYTEWDKQQQAVLAAGRNEEGQQIIPLTYTCPLLVFPKAELDAAKPDHLLTFDEALSDPEWSSLYTEFYDCYLVARDMSAELHKAFAPAYLEYILGKTADFESEELLFTEEELFSVITRVFEVSDESVYSDPPVEEPPYDEGNLTCSIARYNTTPITLLPLYSTDGGVTVSVDSIAAINRNTKMPEEAYTFLDYFMRKNTQLSAHVYRGFCVFGGIPLHTDAFSEDSPFNHFEYLPDESFAELTDVKDQITAVNFQSELTKDLSLLMTECWRADEDNLPISEEIVREAYEQMQRKVRE